MPRIDNIKNGELAALVRNVRTLGTNAPIGFSSVTKGGLRIASSQGLLVQGSSSTTGTANVSGTQNVSGTSTISGTQNVTGASNVSGTQVVSGTQNVSGAQNVTGSQSVSGPFSLTGTQTVSGGGKINVGPLAIAPTGPYGSSLTATTIQIASTQLFCTGEIIGQSGMSLFGLPTTTSAANLFISGLGIVQKVTSAAKYKIDPQPMPLADSLLDVPVEWWIDRSHAEVIAELHTSPRPMGRHDQSLLDDASFDRVPGVIAEKVEMAGGGSFVTRDADGEIEGVAYDRFALARTEILARRLERAFERIEELENRLTAANQ